MMLLFSSLIIILSVVLAALHCAHTWVSWVFVYSYTYIFHSARCFCFCAFFLFFRVYSFIYLFICLLTGWLAGFACLLILCHENLSKCIRIWLFTTDTNNCQHCWNYKKQSIFMYCICYTLKMRYELGALCAALGWEQSQKHILCRVPCTFSHLTDYYYITCGCGCSAVVYAGVCMPGFKVWPISFV